MSVLGVTTLTCVPLETTHHEVRFSWVQHVALPAAHSSAGTPANSCLLWRLSIEVAAPGRQSNLPQSPRSAGELRTLLHTLSKLLPLIMPTKLWFLCLLHCVCFCLDLTLILFVCCVCFEKKNCLFGQLPTALCSIQPIWISTLYLKGKYCEY